MPKTALVIADKRNETVLPILSPALPARLTYSAPAAGTLPLLQVITLHDVGGEPIGRLHWFAPDSNDGVVQIIHVAVDPLHQRRGHGSSLIREAYAQAAKLFVSQGIKPRRVWVTVEQKRHVIGRAFFARHGFHHVSTIKNIYRDQDSVIYQRSLD